MDTEKAGDGTPGVRWRAFKVEENGNTATSCSEQGKQDKHK